MIAWLLALTYSLNLTWIGGGIWDTLRHTRIKIKAL